MPNRCPNRRERTMAPTIEQLEAMSDAELHTQYNEVAKNTSLGLQWWGDELVRRAVNRQNGDTDPSDPADRISRPR